MADPHKGPALQLIHEQPDRPWTLGDLGRRVGLGRSTFSARFTKLIGQPMHRYLIARRTAEASFLLETSDEGVARMAARVGYGDGCRIFKAVPPLSRPIARPLAGGQPSDGGRRQEGVRAPNVAD
jgi:transcriptional regulator GlxA family with amidase domain